MSHKDVVAKIGKLEAMTVERGASPAEADTAASLARRLINQIARGNDPERTVPVTRQSALAPGVHVNIVSRTVLRVVRC